MITLQLSGYKIRESWIEKIVYQFNYLKLRMTFFFTSVEMENAISVFVGALQHRHSCITYSMHLHSWLVDTEYWLSDGGRSL